MAANRKTIHSIIQESAENRTLEDKSREQELLTQNKPKLLSYINNSVLGSQIPIPTPFGSRPLVYADYTASGRSLSFIENYMQSVVLPTYSNTHTYTSWVGLQTSFFRQEARALIERALNASEDDAILFCGSGSTSGANKLAEIMLRTNWGHKTSYFQQNRWGSFDCKLCNMAFATQGKYFSHIKSEFHLNRLPKEQQVIQADTKPVVFVSIMEHHSNILPWREAGAEIVVIPEDQTGKVDLQFLENELSKYRDYPYKVGSFSAGSNVTGIVSDVREITRLLHSYNALAFFDYAAVAPYVKINMNPSKEESIDALFLSVHKFVGGPGTPGVLAIKKSLLSNEVPTTPGGGTVYYVTEKEHTYLLNPEEREEGGTPDVVGSIRAGLVFQLKEAVGEDYIHEGERSISQKVTERLLRNPNIQLLGSTETERIPIFSFMVRCGGKFYHYSFICALLNDLFGIESRGGCVCAGPYTFSLLGIPYELSVELGNALNEGYDLFRVGFVRVNFNYFMSEETIDYILDAIDFVAENAIWFLPQYKFDMERSAFMHRAYSTKEGRHKARKWISEVTYATGEMSFPSYDSENLDNLGSYIQEAHKLAQNIKENRYAHFYMSDNTLEIPAHLEHLRWFILPSEALTFVKGRNIQLSTSESPFCPKNYSHVSLEPKLPEPLPTPKRKDKKKNPLFPKVPKKIIKRVMNAVNDFDMIKEGDRILVCISGGKDSLTMLHALKQVQRVSPKHFEIGAATVDPQVPEYDPSPLKAYLEKLAIPYFYEQYPIVELASAKMTKKVSLCAFCSRMKRGILYSCARREGYNVLALGQHLDDLAESFVMSAFHNGLLRTMKTHYVNDQNDLRIIRPLAYVRERLMKEYAEEAELPVIVENCPACFAAPTERHRTKLLLASQEQLIPDLFSSLLRTMKPVMSGNFEEVNTKRPRNEEEEECQECVFNPV